MRRSIFAAVCVLIAGTAAAQRVTCESPNNQYRECRIATTGKARLVVDMSYGLCVEGATWGTRSDGIVWIDRGCRGIFTVDAPKDTLPKNRLICESVDGEITSCRADTKRGVYLARQLSKNLCIESKTWGFDPERGTIWVDDGCRAEFGLGEPPVDLHATPRLEASVICESENGRRKECAADTSAGVQLVRQLGDKPCIYSKGWGYGDKAIWVDNDCRAEFAVTTPRAMLQTVTCESVAGGRNHCPAETRLGVALARRLDQGACILDQTWGFDADGIWVANGCRAQFALGGFRLPASAVPKTAQHVFCESLDGKPVDCAIDTSRGVGLLRQISEADCVLNRTWGYDRQGIWVKEGCRAEFVVAR